jgi:hypothetical protein
LHFDVRDKIAKLRQHALTFAGLIRTITVPLQPADFEQLDDLAIKNNLGNATLGRDIIRQCSIKMKK